MKQDNILMDVKNALCPSQGRINRVGFIVGVIVIYSALFIDFVPESAIDFFSKIPKVFFWIYIYFVYFMNNAFIFFLASLIAKRLRDINVSGKYTFLMLPFLMVLSPGIPPFYMYYFTTQHSVLTFASLIVLFLFFIVISTIPGTKGNNEYGNQPSTWKLWKQTKQQL